MRNEAGDYANKYTKYVTLKDGESFEGEYESSKIGANPFDDTKELMIYNFVVDGYTKQFKTGSVRFARAMANVEAGKKLRITRHGEGLQTNYDIKVLA